jgi:shikimate kinase
MFDKLKSMDGHQVNFLQLSAEKILEMKDRDNENALFQEQEMEQMDYLINDRDQEINSLVTNINQLG